MWLFPSFSLIFMILQIKMRKFAKKFRCAAIKLGFLSFTRAFAFRNFEKHILGQENFSSEGVFSIRQTSSVKNEPNYIFYNCEKYSLRGYSIRRTYGKIFAAKKAF